MQKFGKNWRKQKAAIARLHQHIANVRRDFIEKVLLLTRSILDQGWGIFFSKLDWKALRLGGHVHKVLPQNTSRTCTICDCVSKDNRKTQASFECVSCRYLGNADEAR